MWYELALVLDDNGTWFVTSPDYPEVATFDKTQEEACRNCRSAIEEAIAARMSDGVDLPAPVVDPSGLKRSIELSALVFLKAALYMIMRVEGRTRADLVRALGCKREHVDRLFRLDHNSRLPSLEEAFKAVGHPLRFDMEFPQAA